MLSKMHETMKRDEAGQALVLGAATLIVLALSVLVTIQLGHVIQKRIQVQNAADNSAYSVAAVVARSLNAIAWMNRTIVSHYVSMMALQSYVSTLSGIQALIGLSSDMLQSIASALCIIKRIADACCAACGAIPFVGAALAAAACATAQILQPIYEAVQKGAEALRTAADEMGSVIDLFDRTIVGPGVMLLSKLNRYGMHVAQQAMKNMTMAALTSIAAASNFQKRVLQETVEGANTSGSTATIYNAAMGLLNGVDSYRNMFDRDGSEKLPDTSTSESDDGPGRKPAARIMAQIANATRLGNGENTWESSRNLDGGLIGTVAKYLGFKYEGSTRLVAPMEIDTFREESGGGAPPSGGGMGGDCAAKSQKCEDAKAKCQDKNAEYEAAEADAASKEQQCQSNTQACSACSDPECQACKDKGSSCSAAQSARNNANNKKNEAENTCDSAKGPCDEANNCTMTLPPASDGNGKKNYVFMNGGTTSSWSRGNALASAEYVKAFGNLSWVSGGGAGKMVGVQASPLQNYSFHCAYGGRKQITVPSCPWYAWTKPIECNKEGHRHKFDGISPYVSFELQDKPSKLFNQPDYWGLVNLAPDKARFPIDTAFGFGSGGNSFTLNSDFGQTQGESGKLENMNKPGLTTSFGEGLNGFARSQVYYHRPGYWAEPPNLFNPYWRAKLAPIAPKFGQLMGSMSGGGFGGQLQDLVSQAMTH